MKNQIIVLMVLFVLLVCISGTLFAHADNYGTLGMSFKDSPIVCICEPHPSYTDKSDEMVLAAKDSVQLWVNALNTHSPNGDWDIETFVIPIDKHHTASAYDFPVCDILITFEHSSTTRQLGFTHMNFSQSSHQYSQSTIFLNDFRSTEHYDLDLDTGEYIHVNTTYKLTEFNMIAVQNIITHEFGHALGLGHYQITDYPIYTDDYPWLEASIMYYALNPDVQELASPTYVDVKMLEEIYYTDGFGGNPVPKIPRIGYYTAGDDDICTFRCSVFK